MLQVCLDTLHYNQLSDQRTNHFSSDPIANTNINWLFEHFTNSTNKLREHEQPARFLEQRQLHQFGYPNRRLEIRSRLFARSFICSIIIQHR